MATNLTSAKKDKKSNKKVSDVSLDEKKSNGLKEIDDLFLNKKKKANEDDCDGTSIKQQKRQASALAKHNGNSSSSQRKKQKQNGDRTDLDGIQKGEWVDDGLGGVFDREGFTGRVVDGSFRVYKAHLMNKKGFGQTKDCPFDCFCCFI